MAEKLVSVKLLGEAKEDYLQLKARVKVELEKGVSKSFHQILLKSLEDKIALLKTNYGYGVQIPKRNIPLKYVQQYGVTNLWKVDLADLLAFDLHSQPAAKARD